MLRRVLIISRGANKMKNKCNLKLTKVKSGLYTVPASGKKCIRKFPKIIGLSKERADETISARKRLIKKALKINKAQWGSPRWE